MVLNFAHRGSLTEAPENTLPAFEKALEHGAQALELDVQLTKDDKLIVCHDHKLTRFNKEANGRIRDYTLEEIKQIDVGTSFAQEFSGVTLPTLEEVLAMCPRDVKLNIEIKNIPVIYPWIEELLINCLKKNNRTENVLISSFDHTSLKRVQEIAPEIELGMLIYYRMLEPWKYAQNSGLNISSIHPNQVYTDRKFVEHCKAAGFKVYPFTVNSIERYEELIAAGVDGLFSNNPKIFSEK